MQLFRPRSACRPSALAGLLRSLIRAVPAFSLACLAMTLFPAPAHAGHWVLTAAVSGNADFGGRTRQTATTPPPATNSVTIAQIAAGDGRGPVFGLPPGTSYGLIASSNLTVTVTGTWTSDTKSDNTPPPGIWFSVSSYANASESSNGGPVTGGAADDGFQDGAPAGSDIGTSATPPATKFVPQTGGTATYTLKLSASATGTANTTGGGSAGTTLGPVTVSVHAQPYNFRLGPFSDPTSGKSYPTGIADDGKGQLYYHYIWESTDGDISHLNSCVVYEHLNYTGNSTGTLAKNASGVTEYRPVNPPYSTPTEATFDQPDPNGSNPTLGTAGYQVDVLIRPPLTSPSIAGTYTYSGIQDWQFNDSETKQTHVELLGPLTIKRTVSGSPSTSWVYTVSKSGSNASYTYH